MIYKIICKWTSFAIEFNYLLFKLYKRNCIDKSLRYQGTVYLIGFRPINGSGSEVAVIRSDKDVCTIVNAGNEISNDGFEDLNAQKVRTRSVHHHILRLIAQSREFLDRPVYNQSLRVSV